MLIKLPSQVKTHKPHNNYSYYFIPFHTSNIEPIASHSFGMKSIPPFLTSNNPELISIPYRYKTEKDAQTASFHIFLSSLQIPSNLKTNLV